MMASALAEQRVRLEVRAEQQGEDCHSAYVDGQALQHVLERQRGWCMVQCRYHLRGGDQSPDGRGNSKEPIEN